MSDERFDVAIVGAGPAGAFSASMLADQGHRVVLIDRATFPRSVICSGWVSAKAEPLLNEAGLPGKKLLNTRFTDVTFYNADLSKSTKPAFEEPPGFLVDRAEFDSGLVKAAGARGAALRLGAGVRGITLKESAVELTLDDETRLESRLLLLAAGRGSELLRQVGFPTDDVGTPTWTAQVVDPKGMPRSSGPAISVVLGLDGAASFGLLCASKHRCTIDVNWSGDREGALPALIALCRFAHANGLIPTDLSRAAVAAELIVTPAAAALDMDSHVRKHTLLIGDAGGFVSAISNEGVYPALWSARIAVDVTHKALSSTHSQDELMAFDSVWRMAMANHLRSPHTDIRFLLPLIFTNQPMADRMGAAFFFGQNV